VISPHLGALALVVGDILMRAARLRLLVGDAWNRGMFSAVRINAYGDAASAVTPGRLGGDPARFVALRQASVATPPAVVALGVEHVVDLSLAILVGLSVTVFLGATEFANVTGLLTRLVSPTVLPWLIGVAALTVLAAAVAIRLRHRFPPVVAATARETLRQARALSRGTLAATVGLTAASMAARVAVLPVLLAGVTAIQDPVGAFAGSFALIYAQLLLPTPGGAGGVELGFVVGFAPLLTTGQIAALLVAWRVYSLVIPAGLGGVLFAGNLLAGPRPPTPSPAGRGGTRERSEVPPLPKGEGDRG
jgi:glycosyltransferase 2 family protein